MLPRPPMLLACYCFSKHATIDVLSSSPCLSGDGHERVLEVAKDVFLYNPTINKESSGFSRSLHRPLVKLDYSIHWEFVSSAPKLDNLFHATAKPPDPRVVVFKNNPCSSAKDYSIQAISIPSEWSVGGSVDALSKQFSQLCSQEQAILWHKWQVTSQKPAAGPALSPWLPFMVYNLVHIASTSSWEHYPVSVRHGRRRRIYVGRLRLGYILNRSERHSLSLQNPLGWTKAG